MSDHTVTDLTLAVEGLEQRFIQEASNHEKSMSHLITEVMSNKAAVQKMAREINAKVCST